MPALLMADTTSSRLPVPTVTVFAASVPGRSPPHIVTLMVPPGSGGRGGGLPAAAAGAGTARHRDADGAAGVGRECRRVAGGDVGDSDSGAVVGFEDAVGAAHAGARAHPECGQGRTAGDLEAVGRALFHRGDLQCAA